MSPILVFYGLAVASVLGIGFVVYRIAARRNPVLAGGLSLLVVLVLAGLWPIPIHGGFTFLAGIFWQELASSWEARERVQEASAERAFLDRLSGRFAGPLSFRQEAALTRPWYLVKIVPSQTPAWFDQHSRLLWSDQLALEGEGRWPTLAEAKLRCGRLPPEGYWALPSEAEKYWFWKAGGERVLPGTPASSIAYLVDADMRVEIPTYDLRGAGFVSPGQHAPKRAFAIRCVARSSETPIGGYTRRNIPLDEWNRYQLAKGNP